MTITNRFALLLLLPLSLVVLGCGSSKKPVARLSGSVKYNGTLVKAGTITFTAKGESGEAGGIYLATIEPDGTYSTSQVPAGEFTVAIETESANPDRAKKEYGNKGKMTSSPRPDYAQAAETPKGAYVKIPDKYKDAKKSGLSVSLTNGKNTKDFELTD